MGNYVDIPNISPELVDLNTKKTQKESTFSTKNYLNVRLDKEKGETEREVVIRLLPMDLKTGSPFVKAHFHTIRVPKAIFNTEWKSYVCLAKNPDIDHERYGNKCPLCEMNKKAYELFEKETDPNKKEEYKKQSIAFKGSDVVIVRCIERGKENEGVKFWKFNLRDDKTDPYNQIMDLHRRKKTRSIEKGEEPENILDLYNGRDLIITIKDSKTAGIIVSCDEDRSPITTDQEQLKKWVYDDKTWQTVFPPKDYDYLSLVINNKYPWFDREQNKWVDREEFNAKKKDEEKKQEEEVKEADLALRMDAEPESVKAFEKSITVDDSDDDNDGDDLPF